MLQSPIIRDEFSEIKKVPPISQNQTDSYCSNIKAVFPNQMVYVVDLRNLHLLQVENLNMFFCTPDELTSQIRKFQLVLEEDLLFCINTWSSILEFLKNSTCLPPDYVLMMEYRIKKRNGEIICVQKSVVTLIHDSNNLPAIIKNTLTDVTFLRKSNFIPRATMYDPVNRKELWTYSDVNTAINTISKRELQVLDLLKNGISSKCIAEKLFISKHTVDCHRRSLLYKTKSKNTTQLVSFAFKYGV